MSKSLYVDEKLLEEKISQKGIKKGFLCEQMGISRNAFDKKRKGKTPFRASEVFVLCTLLNIEDDSEKSKIFNPKVEKEVY